MSIWGLLKQEALNRKGILSIFLIALTYLALTAYILNYRLVLATIFGAFPVSYKLSLLESLVVGLKMALSAFDFYLLLMTSFLFGVNLVLIVKTIRLISSVNNSVKLLFGGSGILAVASTGCTSCGLSLVSILGFGAGLTFLPFGGKFFYFLSIAALLFSIFYMLKKLEAVCKIPQKSSILLDK